MLNVAMLVSEILGQIGPMVKLGLDVTALISKVDAVIASDSVNEPEWAEVKAKRAELSAQLNTDPPPVNR